MSPVTSECEGELSFQQDVRMLREFALSGAADRVNPQSFSYGAALRSLLLHTGQSDQATLREVLLAIVQQANYESGLSRALVAKAMVLVEQGGRLS